MELNEGTRKRGRASGGLAGELDQDRLSALPDCLLHAIMSFLKARQVVQTCVLSTRWRNLWRTVPCLDVDLDEFKQAVKPLPEYSDPVHRFIDDSDSEDEYEDGEQWEDFEDFAVNLMLRRNISVLDSFRLSVRSSMVPYFGNRRAGTWVRRAMKYCGPDPSIQREGLSSSSWRLKRLHLCNVVLDTHFADHVSSACHSLEDLELKDCTCLVNSINSRSLKRLVLKDCIWRQLSDITSSTLKSLVIDSGSNTRGFLLVITTPDVAYLRLTVGSGFGAGISINGMPFLAKASITLCGGRASALCRDQFKLLCSLSNVTSLELSSFETMVMPDDSTAFGEFKNLRNLVLDACDLSDDFQTLGLFLQNSPNLEKLTLRCCNVLNDSKNKKGTPKSNKASSSQCRSLVDVQCKNLKNTEIIYEDDDIRQLVELLLRISGNLPKNNIKLTKVD
ncbi:hypothetical protein ACP70R_007424 [Stipagrostis hirtigluma subsp. patula]